jgi:hypothetical protein
MHCRRVGGAAQLTEQICSWRGGGGGGEGESNRSLVVEWNRLVGDLMSR